MAQGLHRISLLVPAKPVLDSKRGMGSWDSLRVKSTKGGMNDQLLKGAYTELFGLGPKLPALV